MNTLPDQKNSVPVMELSGIRKSFNVGTPIENEVLHGIDLILPQGEFCAVMGPSGSGKSTLMHLLGAMGMLKSEPVEP